MHTYLVNGAIQVIPLAQDRHPYEWVDIAIEAIQRSGIEKYEVQAFATEMEGRYDQIMEVYHAVNERLMNQGCAEWITNLQIQIRCDRDMPASEKTDKYRKGLS
jgi:uncharacterized protein YqgV (UPF0045/DUF77 family)